MVGLFNFCIILLHKMKGLKVIITYAFDNQQCQCNTGTSQNVYQWLLYKNVECNPECSDSSVQLLVRSHVGALEMNTNYKVWILWHVTFKCVSKSVSDSVLGFHRDNSPPSPPVKSNSLCKLMQCNLNQYYFPYIYFSRSCK